MRGRTGHEPGADRSARSDWWGVVLDAADGPALARFYAALLGWETGGEDAGWATLVPPDGVAYLGFQTAEDYAPPVWPAREGARRMTLHLDFEVTDLSAAVAHARELGAREAEHQPQEHVRVLVDPAGHPFCLYTDADNDTAS
ncbi:VOC family protein [Streptomyces sp. NPDC048182]|uniref:VOC family protein n=1 Tax=Streptomyces sp. NPDC048182 TaxID=3365507 RepID=UPI003716258E